MLYPLVSFFLYTYLHMCISNINLPKVENNKALISNYHLNLGITTMNLVKSKDMDYKVCSSGIALLDKLLLNEKNTFRVWFFVTKICRIVRSLPDPSRVPILGVSSQP